MTYGGRGVKFFALNYLLCYHLSTSSYVGFCFVFGLQYLLPQMYWCFKFVIVILFVLVLILLSFARNITNNRFYTLALALG